LRFNVKNIITNNTTILTWGKTLASTRIFKMSLHSTELNSEVDEIAPDGSEIRFLSRTDRATMVHCTLPCGFCTIPVEHKTVDEIWYFLTGKGEVWRELEGRREIVVVQKGVSLNVPLHTVFQFKNTGDVPLEFIIVTLPPWPGDDEAILRKNYFD